MDEKIILSINNTKISYDSFLCKNGLIIYKIIQIKKSILSIHYDYKLHMLVVLANWWLSKEKIKNFIKNNYYYKLPNTSLNINNFNKVLFLGDLIDASVIYAKQSTFTFTNNKLTLYVQNKDEIKKIIINFYKKYALLFFPTMLRDELLKLNLSGKFGKVWFSCGYRSITLANCESSTRTINFNAYIMQYSKQYIYSIIYHEIAHLTYPHHKKDFWDLFNAYCPNAKNIPLFNCDYYIGINTLVK